MKTKTKKKKTKKKIVCFVCVFKSQPPVPAPLAVPSFSSVFVSTSKKNDDSDKCLVIITDPCVCVSSTICFLSLPPPHSVAWPVCFPFQTETIPFWFQQRHSYVNTNSSCGDGKEQGRTKGEMFYLCA